MNVAEIPSNAALNFTPARFVTIDLASLMTGLSAGAIRTKIARGIWLEDRQYVRREGRVFIDIEGYEKWAESGQA